MAWCHKATNPLSEPMWPRSMPSYGVTRSKWINQAPHISPSLVSYRGPIVSTLGKKIILWYYQSFTHCVWLIWDWSKSANNLFHEKIILKACNDAWNNDWLLFSMALRIVLLKEDSGISKQTHFPKSCFHLGILLCLQSINKNNCILIYVQWMTFVSKHIHISHTNMKE